MNSSQVEILPKEEEYKKKAKAKAVQNQERLTQLYLKAQKKTENIKKLAREKHERLAIEEMEGCTFKPKTNAKNWKGRNRSVQCEQRNKERTLKSKEKIMQEEKEDCTFKPKISKIDNIMKSFGEKTKYDRSSQKYFQRINKARVSENERKQKLNPDYNLIYDKVYKKGHTRLNTITITHETKDEYCTFNPNNTSTIDYCTYKKTLHEQLHTITVGDESTNYVLTETMKSKSDTKKEKI